MPEPLPALRPPRPRRWPVVFAAVAAAISTAHASTPASTLAAQPAVRPAAVSVSEERHLLPTAEEWPVLIVMPFTGALGAHVLGSPEGWDRTWGGYANRLGDQVGFLLIEETVRRTLTVVLPATAPRDRCWRDGRNVATNLTAGSACALWSMVAVRPAEGSGWRFNAPVTLSLLTATGASLAWRPERSDAAKARSFLLVRTGIVFGGMAAARLFEDWRAKPHEASR